MKQALLALVAGALLLHPAPAAAVGGPSNVVVAMNYVDNNLVVEGRAQVNREPGAIAAPLNFASARSSCNGCQTIAVALQMNYGSFDSHLIAPQNFASAVNITCDGCVTVAVAYQIYYQVDDPTQLPPGAQDLILKFNATLRTIANDRTISLSDAIAQLNAVVAEFQSTFTTLDVQQSASGI